MAEENRRDLVADALRPVLEEGEAYTVFCHEGEIHVSDAETSVCAVRNPRLYGRLLSMNTQIEEAGSGLGRLPFLIVLAFCVGLHLHLLDAWIGQPLADQLDSAWFYVLVIFATFVLLETLRKPLARMAYNRGREELNALIHREDLDRDRLLAMIEDDPAVSQVGHYLKLDDYRANG
jgi:hypothetical protein